VFVDVWDLAGFSGEIDVNLSWELALLFFKLELRAEVKFDWNSHAFAHD